MIHLPFWSTCDFDSSINGSFKMDQSFSFTSESFVKWGILRNGSKPEFDILGEIICKTRSKWQTITKTVLCKNEYETVRNCSDVIDEYSGKN